MPSFNRILTARPSFLGRESAPQAADDRCSRCGASASSFMPVTLMCGACRDAFAGQAWRRPVQLR